MSGWVDYDFAVVCVVPHVHLYGSSAVGVVLHARQAEFIDARVTTDPTQLAARIGGGDATRLSRYLESYRAVARGEVGSPLALLPPSERFHWLTAPRSDLIQCSPVHSGRSQDPATTLEALFRQYVPR
ncbi:MAG: DUF3037 domain-containing protein [Gemmatimonadota bacterium]